MADPDSGFQTRQGIVEAAECNHYIWCFVPSQALQVVSLMQRGVRWVAVLYIEKSVQPLADRGLRPGADPKGKPDPANL